MKKSTKPLSLLLVFCCIFTMLAAFFLPIPASAAADFVPITLNGQNTGINAYILEDGVTYITFRTAASILFPDASVFWDKKNGAATLQTRTLTITAEPNTPYIVANGRYLALSGLYPAENKLVDGTTYIPLRLIARAAGAEIRWNGERRRVELSTTAGAGAIQSGDTFYDADEVYWLSKIIYAEAGDQPLRGQLAVGAVVMNRVRSEKYPDTIYGVIYDTKYGVQFSPIADGAINKTPSEMSIIAAKLVLDGCIISEDALYFLDPQIAESDWIVRNCTALFQIGCHDFYS